MLKLDEDDVRAGRELGVGDTVDLVDVELRVLEVGRLDELPDRDDVGSERVTVLERRSLEVCKALSAVDMIESSVVLCGSPEIAVAWEIVLTTVMTSVEPDTTRVEITLEAAGESILLAELSLREADCAGSALDIVRIVVEPKVTKVEVATATSEDTVLLAKAPAPELED